MKGKKQMRSFFEKVPILTGERVTLKAVDMSCADGMRELVSSVSVYQYLPTFLFEKNITMSGM